MLSRTTLVAIPAFLAGLGLMVAACGDDESTITPGTSDGGASSSTSSSGGSSSGSTSSTSSSGGSSSGSTSSSSGSTSSSSGGDAGTTDKDPCRGQPLPTADHHVPAGMCASLVSANKSGLRQIAFAPNGDILGASGNTIWLYRDADNDGFFESTEIHNWGTIAGGNNVHLEGSFAYAGGTNSVKRYAYTAAAVTGGTPEDVVVSIPSGGTHPRHTVHVYDGWLYVTCGSNNNMTHEGGEGAADYDTSRSLIKRFNLASFTGTPLNWNTGEVVSAGVRNAVGFKRNETTKKIYAVVNGLDNQSYKAADIHQDNPGEQIIEVAAGKNYGYPFCFTAQRIVDGALIAPGTQLTSGFGNTPKTDAWCDTNSTKPTTFVQAHTAPLDIAFFDNTTPAGGLPEKYRGGAFIALHGSWNRTSPTGFKVIWQPFNADGTAPLPTSTAATTTFPYEVIFGRGNATAPQEGSWSWSDQGEGESTRPSGVGVSPVDGALYVVSDTGGYIYRVGMKKN